MNLNEVYTQICNMLHENKSSCIVNTTKKVAMDFKENSPKNIFIKEISRVSEDELQTYIIYVITDKNIKNIIYDMFKAILPNVLVSLLTIIIMLILYKDYDFNDTEGVLTFNCILIINFFIIITLIGFFVYNVYSKCFKRYIKYK